MKRRYTIVQVAAAVAVALIDAEAVAAPSKAEAAAGAAPAVRAKAALEAPARTSLSAPAAAEIAGPATAARVAPATAELAWAVTAAMAAPQTEVPAASPIVASSEPRTAALAAEARTGSTTAPAKLSETGLYTGKGTGTKEIDPRNLPFSPQYPLWSDGAVKSRWIRLPEGKTIDVSDIDAWQFPVGTKLWKQFVFGGRKIETRMLLKASAERWVFATYVWNEDETDATLAPETGIPDVVEIVPGKRHSIPAIADCAACHQSSPSTVLGFNALQLSDDRDPGAPHGEPLRSGMVTLRTLLDEGRLSPPRRELVDSPPRIRATNPRERSALGYLSSNCGACHNATGPLARLGLVLAHDSAGGAGETEPGIETALEVPGRFDVPGAPEGTSRRIAPGGPGRSAILYRMRSRRPSSQMPPLGTVVPDEEAIRLVDLWISRDLGAGGAEK
jgi:hypothetical protein